MVVCFGFNEQPVEREMAGCAGGVLGRTGGASVEKKSEAVRWREKRVEEAPGGGSGELIIKVKSSGDRGNEGGRWEGVGASGLIYISPVERAYCIRRVGYS